ncbi:MAG: hypothetical protein PUB90_05820 [bacterium]|nr:hypothetical protein [bacterium]
MRKKKLILAMLIALCTTGCTVDYNLVIEDNKIKETTTFHQDSSDTDTKSYMYSQYLEEYPIYIDEEYLYYDPNKKVEGNTYYDKSITDDSNGYNATYKAEFKIKEYNRSRLFNDVFVNHSSGYDKKEGCYYIIADDIKTFRQDNTVTNINVSINLVGYKVIESNQDSVNNNTYTWYFDKDNQKSIILKYKNDNGDPEINQTDNKNVSNKKESKYTMYIFYGIIVLVILIGYLIFRKMKKSNDINNI